MDCAWRRVARVAGLCGALLACARVAGAQQAAPARPRTVAVINLAGERGAAAAARLREALGAHAQLVALPEGELSRALEAPAGPAPIDAAAAVARRELDAAEEALSRFQLDRARAAVGRARAALDAAPPSPARLADAAFLAALIELRAGEPDRAARELELAQRLAPARPALDPVRYPPQVIAADRAARARVAAAEALRVRIASEPPGATVFVDGRRRGRAPLELSLGAGPHHVAAVAPAHQAAAALLDTGSARHLALTLEPMSVAERARAWRRRALSARSGAALRQAARRISDLAGVDAALIVTGDGQPVAAVYERRADRLSYRRPVDAQVARLFGLLVPAGEPALVVPRPEPAPWYARPWGIAALGGGALTALITAIAISADEPQERSFSLGGFETASE